MKQAGNPGLADSGPGSTPLMTSLSLLQYIRVFIRVFFPRGAT